MKFYVLVHPDFGYLKSKQYRSCTWTDDIAKAKKWSWLAPVKSCLTQTGNDILRKCSIEIIEYHVIKKTLL